MPKFRVSFALCDALAAPFLTVETEAPDYLTAATKAVAQRVADDRERTFMWTTGSCRVSKVEQIITTPTYREVYRA